MKAALLMAFVLLIISCKTEQDHLTEERTEIADRIKRNTGIIESNQSAYKTFFAQGLTDEGGKCLFTIDSLMQVNDSLIKRSIAIDMELNNKK